VRVMCKPGSVGGRGGQPPRSTRLTEDIRKQMLAEINAVPGSREYLEAKHGQVWDTQQLSDDFEVIGFAAPLVVVRRKSDG